MKLTKEEKDRLEEIYQYFLNDQRVMRMKAVPMHRGSNCYEHSFKVAKKAIKHGLRRINKEKIDLEVILVGAILHDYYLYDWRSDRSKRKRHCHNHPDIAVANAVKDFAISKKVQFPIRWSLLAKLLLVSNINKKREKNSSLIFLNSLMISFYQSSFFKKIESSFLMSLIFLAGLPA